MKSTKPSQVTADQEVTERTVRNIITLITPEAALKAANDQIWSEAESSVHAQIIRSVAEETLGTITWKSQWEGSRECFEYRWHRSPGHVCRIYLDLFPMISCGGRQCRSLLMSKTETLREGLANRSLFYQKLWGMAPTQEALEEIRVRALPQVSVTASTWSGRNEIITTDSGRY
jgi:hypothetical protein